MSNISGLASGSIPTSALSAVSPSADSQRGTTSAKGATPNRSNADPKTNAATSAAKHTDLNVHTDSAGAVQAQINQDQIQLNDWVTCVSASTPKGKEEIQSISTQISAAESRLRAIEESQAAAKAATQGAAGATDAAGSASRVDAWA